MTEDEYLRFLSRFRFAEKQRQRLLAIRVRITEADRTALGAVIDAIEKTIRTYRIDLRTYKVYKPPFLKDLRKAIAETVPVRERIDSLVKNHRTIDAIRYHDRWLLTLSADLGKYEALLQEIHEFIENSNRGSGEKPGGRPVNRHLFILAIDIGRHLKIHGFRLVKSRNGLFYQLYIAILEMLHVEKSDPWNYIKKGCDYLKDFDPNLK